VDESVPAERVASPHQADGREANQTQVRPFDVYRGEQIGSGKKVVGI